MLGEGYASDDSRAYCRGAVITDPVAERLETLGGTGHVKTASQVFYQGKLLVGVHAAVSVLAEPGKPQSDASDQAGLSIQGERVSGAR